ncbi:MAG: class I SAM-dependent methyltransferase [Candidatus Omnitrophota bacterium]
MGRTDKDLISRGIKVADSRMYRQDKIWSKYSRDKVDIGEKLAAVIRVLHKKLPLNRPIRALSVGSSDEPQFRILEAVFRGGLYLLDIEKPALEIVDERIRRQSLDHVRTVCGDYTRIFRCGKNTALFLDKVLGGRKVELITLHHSLYYCQEPGWDGLFDNLYRKILAPKGAMHAVMMASKSDDEYTTSWLYGHFAGKYFGCHNDQDLWHFKRELEKDPVFAGSEISIKRSRVSFFVDDFEEFMAVIWMIMLYPNVHRYTRAQKEEITEFVLRKFWIPKKPLVQEQDHLVVLK